MLSTKILSWYRSHGRNLPWRGLHDPYTILLSELMLQQTQVSRVVVKLPLFLAQYTDFASLASASPAAIIRAWQGMGYNNRVLRFQKLCQIVVERYGGQLPDSVDVMQNLPGVGKYTAHAVACFAFGQAVPVVDVNIRRFYSRIFWKLRYFHEMKSEKEIWSIASNLLPPSAYDYNQALMDLGSICIARNPRCMKCPVASDCKSASALMQGRLVKKQESSLRGVPNRIYRGKIIEFLCGHAGWQQSFLVGKAVVPLFSPHDHDWLISVIHSLQKDGLLMCKGEFITLPEKNSGTFK